MVHDAAVVVVSLSIYIEKYPTNSDLHNPNCRCASPSGCCAATKKVSRGLGMEVTVQAMYKSLIEPHFRYCCPVWGAAGITALQKLKKLQNRAARIVTNSAYHANSEPIIQILGWATIKQLIELETAKVVYKALQNEAPDYIKRTIS